MLTRTMDETRELRRKLNVRKNSISVKSGRKFGSSRIKLKVAVNQTVLSLSNKRSVFSDVGGNVADSCIIQRNRIWNIGNHLNCGCFNILCAKFHLFPSNWI